MSQNIPRKILFLASWYPSKVHSTLGNFCQRHARAISTQHDVTVLYLTKDTKLKSNYLIEDEITDGLREIICYYKNKGILGSGYIKAFYHAIHKTLKDEIKTFDITHVNVLYKAGWLALQLKKQHKMPYVITEHWTGYHINQGKNIGFIQRYLSKKISKKSDRILPVSNHLGASMAEFGLNGNYQVIPNVVDTDLFRIKSKKEPSFTFIHVSSLKDDHKNVSGIIRAFSKVKDQIPAKLHIIGDGNTQPYRKLAQKMKLSDKQFLIEGEKSIEDVAELVGKSHCLILFSNYENQPCVIPEAYATGIPVIATDVGGIKEHLTEKHGLLISKLDEEALENAMLSVYRNRESYDSQWLRDYSVQHFSVNAIATSFSKTYEQIL